MLVVTCALIEHKEKLLICQRSAKMKMPLQWEFPGGKVAFPESMEDAILREIQEELGITITIKYPLTPVHHQYSDLSLHLHPFVCQWLDGQIHLTEHAQALWVSVSELDRYNWSAADIPVYQEYRDLKK